MDKQYVNGFDKKLTKAMALMQEAKDDALGEAKRDLRGLIDTGRQTLSEWNETVTEQAKHLRDDAETRVKEHPFTSIAAVGLAGVLLGFLFGRRRS